MAILVLGVPVESAPLPPPGYLPESPGLHALTGATIITQPGQKLVSGTLVIRDGRIAAVGPDVPVPAGARIWNLTNHTIYAGFIDAALRLKTTNATRGAISTATDFYGVGNEVRMGGRGLENPRVTPHRRALEGYRPEFKELSGLRELGFTAGNVVLEKGVIRGVSGLVALSDANANEAVIQPEVFEQIAFETGGRDRTAYPASLMGVIALVRQTFLDARFHAGQNGADRPFEPALDALAPVLSGQRAVLFEPGSALMVDRASRLAEEFQVRAVQLSSGQEWRRPDLAQASPQAFIVPLNFPEVPDLPDEEDWFSVTLDQLRAWDWAPENPALLRRLGREVALTTWGLKDKAAFRKNLRLALDRGLSEDDALAALTVVPARLCGVENLLGTIAPGKLANLTIVRGGSFFEVTNKVAEVWIAGKVFRVDPAEQKDPAAEAPPAAESGVAGRAKEDKAREEAKARDRRELLARRLARSPTDGRGPLLEPPSVLVKNGTVWTCGPAGRMENGDVLIVGGRVQAVGKNLAAQAGAHVIDATGRHVTPGLIDCHNHSMILGRVNEPTLPSTAMVRVSDVVNSESRHIELQLAGGMTVANLLHGSANPIGGQNCVIKLRQGASPERLKVEGAPAGIKFALGENVKQSNWGDEFKTRFPQSRMGVPAFLRNRFQAALAYREQRSKGVPVRQDLEMEALVEILEGRRLIHCHSYRQDEVVAFLRVMESFGVRVATLQHILEGYKVADEIAAHGAGASCFADWWAYKYEVWDAIPYAGSLMHQRGVLVSFNSDSSDLARRLNLEAAKAVKYGGTSEEEALKFVTLNPALQLRIADRVGSLQPGKDGDFVLWSRSPLDSTTVCLETWIDGKQYFHQSAVPARTDLLEKERTELLAKARKVSGLGKGDEAAQALFFKAPIELNAAVRLRDCVEEE